MSAVFSFVLTLVAPSCGGASDDSPARNTGGPSRGLDAGRAFAENDAEEAEDTGPTSDDDVEVDEDEVFDDMGCPEVPAPIRSTECDPFQPEAECGGGRACKPFVEYPSSPCEPERFGARCDWVGTGVQGDRCDNGSRCAAGYLCVATGQGTQCAKLCPLPSASGCPPGLVCGSIDIEGVGTCF